MKKKLNILLILFFSVLNMSCKDKITYSVKDVEERNQHGGFIFNKENLNYLDNNGAKIYLLFDKRYGKTKQKIAFQIITKEKFESISIKSIKIKYAHSSNNFIINRDYRERLFMKSFVENNENLYYGYVHYDDSDVVIDFKKLFKELNLEIGDEFPLSIDVNYKIDDKEYKQEAFFLVLVYEKSDFAPSFMYKYFKGF